MTSIASPKRHHAAGVRRWVQPVQGYSITTPFGQKGSSWMSGYHTGSDFACPSGTAVRVVAPGRVARVGEAGSYGLRVCVTHSPGFETWYCHLSSIGVRSGQQLAAGDVLGRSGETGNTTGPHLHLEVRVNGVAKDPGPYLAGAADAPATSTDVNGSGSIGAHTNPALVPSADSNASDSILVEIRRLTIIATVVLGGVALVAVGIARGSNFHRKGD